MRVGQPVHAVQRRAHLQQLGAFEPQLHLGELLLQALEFAERPAELLAGQRILAREVEGVAADGHRRAELPSRSALKPGICFLNPPGPSSTFSLGTRTLSKWSCDHSSPFMKDEGWPTSNPGVPFSISTEPMPDVPGP